MKFTIVRAAGASDLKRYLDRWHEADARFQRSLRPIAGAWLTYKNRCGAVETVLLAEPVKFFFGRNPDIARLTGERVLLALFGPSHGGPGMTVCGCIPDLRGRTSAFHFIPDLIGGGADGRQMTQSCPSILLPQG